MLPKISNFNLFWQFFTPLPQKMDGKTDGTMGFFGKTDFLQHSNVPLKKRFLLYAITKFQCNGF